MGPPPTSPLIELMVQLEDVGKEDRVRVSRTGLESPAIESDSLVC